MVETRSSIVAVMRHEHQRSAKFEQALFQNLERRYIQIVRRFVEQQQVRRLKHELGD